MKRFLALLALAIAPVPALAAAPQTPAPGQAQPQAEAQRWTVTSDRVRLPHAGIAFPRRAGVTAAYRTDEFSHQGEGLDNGLQYQTQDQQVFATVYVYYPGLAHGGLSAIATDQALRSNSTTELTGGDVRIVAAGGLDGVALRRDYGGYRGNLASSAAFIKLGRWVVKLRVSGPEARRAEVLAAMDALLAGISFEGTVRPHPAAPIALGDCSRGSGERPARLLPDPATAEITGQAVVATLDGGGLSGNDAEGRQHWLPSRVPADLCLSRRARVGNRAIPILRAAAGPAPAADGRTMLLAFVDDAGGMFELVQVNNGRYWLFRHMIGETILLGNYDGVPSDDQILALMTRQSDETRIRARVRLKADGDQEIILNTQDGARPAAPTT